MDVKPLDCIIIGAQKAGTTSLHSYLDQHSQVQGNKSVIYDEFSYFVRNDLYKKGYTYAFDLFYQNHGDFNDPLLSAKNAALLYSEKGLKRLYQHNNDVKIIIILRNPIYRAVSSYFWAKRKGKENSSSLYRALTRDLSSIDNYIDKHVTFAYVDCGLYSKHLNNVFNIFQNKDNIKILFFEKFKENAQDIMEELFDFLGLRRERVDTSKIHNKAGIQRYDFMKKYHQAENPFKKLIKTLIPVKIRSKIGNFIDKINERELTKSKDYKEKVLDKKSLKYMQDIYRKDKEKVEYLLNKKIEFWDYL